MSERIAQDLEKSGLRVDDLRARALENLERAATGVPAGVSGYVIPYYDMQGAPIPFYRVRAFDFDPKYKQIKNTGNHIYFPRGFRKLALENGYVIITEGEKKAACAVKNGFPCVGLGGVDSWRNRTLVLPENTKFNRVPGKEAISVKIEDLDVGALEADANLAAGLQDLIDLCISKNLTVILCYDTDIGGVKFDVQRALAGLAFELRYKGIPLVRIKQLILPTGASDKVALDDFVVTRGVDKFKELIRATRDNPKGFPKHPNVQEYISKRLGKQKLFRKEAQQISLAILADLDTRGSRLRNKNTGFMYFFDDATRTLMDATLRRSPTDILQDTEFARYLWRIYGIGPNDQRVLTWLATLFTAEEPIGTAEPCKVVVAKGDIIAYQINDGQYLAISPDSQKPFEVRNNGTGGILFESGLVEPLDAKELLDECNFQMKERVEPLWPKVLADVRLKAKEHNVQLLSLLFYLSPWINRWHGTQLPIEMAIGEPGSGKSSLYEIRLNILTGSPKLRNAPNDLKDWYASITSTGGMHVTDNLQMSDKMLRQRLSDEMCRLVTEPQPYIEMRKYFTNSDLIRLPVFSTFAITAVQQPFHNSDLMQRSVIIEFDKGENIVEYQSNWSQMQLDRFGGRKRWLAHHITTLHKFLKAAKQNWDPTYRAGYRLMNVEQSLVLMARVIGMEDSWIPKYLSSSALDATRDADWAFEGIIAYASEMVRNGEAGKRFSAADISDWAKMEDEYSQCIQLTNSRSLGRYIQSHKQMLATVAGLKEMGKYGNRDTYMIDKAFAKSTVQKSNGQP